MKSFQKSLVILCAILMILGCTMPVFATGGTPTTKGSITVKAPSGVTLKGRTLEALQLFSATYNDAYTEAVYHMSADQLAVARAISLTDPALTVDSSSEAATIKSIREWLSPKAPAKARTAAELEKFAQAVLTANNNRLPSTSLTVAPDGTKATADNLDLGYYLVVDKTADADFKGDLQTNTKSLVMLQNTKPNIEVDLKATSVPFDKKIDNNVVGDGNKKNDPESESADLVYDTHSIGEIVKYKLTSAVPDMYGYDHYYFGLTDTLAKGLLYQNDLSIKIGNKTLAEGTDYVLTVDPNPATGKDVTKIEFYLKNALDLFKGHKGEEILVNYTAKVTKDAVIGQDGNPNTAQVWFKRNPDEHSDKDNPSNPSGKTPEKHTKSFVTEFKLYKTDDTGNAPLAGATFTLTGDRVNTVLVTGEEYLNSTAAAPAGYTIKDAGPFYKLKGGTYTKEAPKPENKDKYDNEGKDTYKLYSYEKLEKEAGTPKTITLTTGPDGKLTFTGLGAGTYTLTETQAPAGYNPAKPMTIKITCHYGDDQKTGSGEAKCTWNYQYKLESEGESEYKYFDGHAPGTDLSNPSLDEITIKNTSNTTLPETGGIGTTIFYTIGGLLALVAVVVLVSRKRMLSNQR